jgi:hypothetical protein
MNDLREFAASSNGDHWFLGTDAITRQPFLLHRGNAPSGGHENRTSLDAFSEAATIGPREGRAPGNA